MRERRVMIIDGFGDPPIKIEKEMTRKEIPHRRRRMWEKNGVAGRGRV